MDKQFKSKSEERRYAHNNAINRRVRLALEAVKGLSDDDLEAGAVEKLVEAAKLGLKEMKLSLDAQGGCDHSVNICVCGLMADIKEVKAALKPWEVKS